MGRCLGLYFFGCGDIANMSQPRVTPPPDLPEKDALIAALVARIEALVADRRIEAKLGLPPKTPDNPAFRRRRGRSRRAIRAKGKAKPHVGHIVRFMQPNCQARCLRQRVPRLRRRRILRRASPCEAYDRVEILRSSPT